MNRGAILHSCILPDIYAKNRSLLSFRLRTAREDAAECSLAVYARTTPERIRKFRMTCSLRDKEADYYTVEVPFPKWQDTRNTISNWWEREAKSCI